MATIREELESFFVTPAWVAEYWGCPHGSVNAAIHRGLIPAHRIRTAKHGHRYNHYIIDIRDLPPRHVELPSNGKSLYERFDELYERRGRNECWPWHGPMRRGHGRFSFADNNISAHRLAWERVHGPIPKGYHIHHTCRVKECVNPKHMELMTAGDHLALHRKETNGRRRRK